MEAFFEGVVLFSFLVSERSFSRLSNLEEKAEIVEESCSILETRAATDWGDDGGGGEEGGEWKLGEGGGIEGVSFGFLPIVEQ